jgi:hypothetical protein
MQVSPPSYRNVERSHTIVARETAFSLDEALVLQPQHAVLLHLHDFSTISSKYLITHDFKVISF